MHRYANPNVFMRLSGRFVPVLAVASALVLAVGLYLGLLVAPADYQQGETVRIMFVHVPAAWLAMGAYLATALASAGFLIWRHPLADVAAKCAVPLGAAFTVIALATGALWGRPTWGTYWAWDARLTSVLILLFLYLGLMALRRGMDDEIVASRLTAVLALVGVVILPVIKFSVDWWNTLHQPSSVLKLSGSTIHSSILIPLLVMAAGALLLFITMHLMAMRNEIRRRRLKANQLRAVERAARQAPSLTP